MKYNILYIAAIGLATMFAGCSSDEFGNMADGQGKLVLTPEVNTEIKEVVVGRATTESREDLLNRLHLAVKNSRGEVLHYWNDVTGIPWENQTHTSIVQTMNAGTYTIEGWTGDDTPIASWDQRYFKGEQKFEIIAGGETDVTLTCTIANTAVAVEYDRVDEVLKDYKIVVSSSSTFLTFDKDETRTGYFLLPSDNKNLEYTITGTKNDGTPYSRTEKISNAKPATKYTIKVSYTDPAPTGGSAITVKIDETPLVKETHTVNFRTRPEITGRVTDYETKEPVDFNLGDEKPFSVTKNEIGEIVLTARSSGRITSVELIHEGLSNLPEGTLNLYGDNDASELRNQLAEAGISGKLEIDEDNQTTSFPITFASSLTDALEKGTYKFAIKVTDEAFCLTDEETDRDPKFYETVFTLVVTESGPGVIKVVTTVEEQESLFKDEILMKGRTTGEVDEVGFFYRKTSDDNTLWEYVKAEVDDDNKQSSIKKNTDFSVKISGLKLGEVEYEYIPAYNNTFPESDENRMTAKTGIAPQLPNAGFEISEGSKPTVFYQGDKSSNMFWDSGNHGSCSVSIVARDVTTLSSEVKNSGKYSIKLHSQSIFGVLAAGNIFIGEYLRTDGTNGVLGWGREFEGLRYYPKKLKGYVKYKPGTVSSTHEKVPDIVKGQPDQGIIYIALLDEDCNVQGNGTYPVEVRTKDAHLFNKDASNVIAYGEKVFDKATEGSGMIEFTIDLEYYRNGEIPKYIMITASASKGGDYFAGADGSVMYLDDLELVYE